MRVTLSCAVLSLNIKKCFRRNPFLPFSHLFITNVILIYCVGLRPSDVTLKLHGLSPRANYTDRATAACRRSVASG
jgi:hypothetical protein